MPYPAWATFPVVAASNTGEDFGSVDHDVDLPSGISSGDLLMLFIACRNSTLSITTPSGWTIIGATFTSGGESSGHSRSGVYYRVANGSETSPIVVTTSGVTPCAYVTKRITGQHAATAPEGGTPSSGSSATPDPPNLAPSWGAEDTLWMTMYGLMDSVTTSIYPYADGNVTTATTAGSNVTIGYCEQNENAASDNPGTFTASGSDLWGAQTIAVRPASASASSFGKRRRHF